MSAHTITRAADAAAPAMAFVKWLVAGIVLINLFVIGMAALSLQESWNRNEENAGVVALNLSLALAQSVAGDIEKIDVALLSVADEIERQAALGDIDRQALNAFLARQQARLPEIFSLRTLDAAGIVSYGPGVDPGARQNNSDRDYYIRQRENPQAGLVIASLVFTRIDKKWAVPVSRSIHRADGSFGGIVYANVGMEHLTRSFAAIDAGRRGSVSLRDAEMRILAHYPPPQNVEKVIGERLLVPPLQGLIKAAWDAGTYITDRTVDGVERKFAVHRIPGQSLYIVVGRATDDYRSPWRDQLARTVALVALFSLLTLTAAWLLYRGWQRQLAGTERLAHEEEKFHTMADYTYDWEYWEGVDRQIVFMSPSCERVTGYSRPEFLSDPDLPYRIIHPDDKHLMADHRHDVAHLDDAEVDFRIVRRDGQIRWIAHGCRAVPGRAGQSIGRRISNRDITERKWAEEQLRKSEERLREYIGRAPIGMAIAAPDGRFIEVNRALCRVVGYEAEELLALGFEQITYPDDLQNDLDHLHRLESGEIDFYEIEKRYLRKDGSVVSALLTASLVRDEHGQPLQIIKQIQDVTQRKRAEEEVHRLNEELEQRVEQRTALLEAANKELEEFSYSMSHDMYIPLRAIDGFSKMLIDEHSARLDAEGKRLLKVVRDSAQRMGLQIDAILHFLRMGKRKMECGPVDIAGLAREVFAELQAGAPSRRLRLDIGDLPQAWGDREMLRQILINLLSNAVKFSPPQEEAVIELSGAAAQEENVYAVKDHGVGFDMQYVDKLFKVFERVHPTGQYEGTGIGLAIVKRIVERHGGRVWARGEVGAGATFHFSLPLKAG